MILVILHTIVGTLAVMGLCLSYAGHKVKRNPTRSWREQDTVFHAKLKFNTYMASLAFICMFVYY